MRVSCSWTIQNCPDVVNGVDQIFWNKTGNDGSRRKRKPETEVRKDRSGSPSGRRSIRETAAAGQGSRRKGWSGQRILSASHSWRIHGKLPTVGVARPRPVPHRVHEQGSNLQNLFLLHLTDRRLATKCTGLGSVHTQIFFLSRDYCIWRSFIKNFVFKFVDFFLKRCPSQSLKILLRQKSPIF